MASKWRKIRFFKTSYKQMWQNRLLMLNFVVFKKNFESFSYGLISWITCLGTRGTPPKHIPRHWDTLTSILKKSNFHIPETLFWKANLNIPWANEAIFQAFRFCWCKKLIFSKNKSDIENLAREVFNMDLNSFQL